MSQSIAKSLFTPTIGLANFNKHLHHCVVGSVLMTIYRWYTDSLTSIVAMFLMYHINSAYEYCDIFIKTVYRDALSLFRFLRTQFFLYRLKNKNLSVPKIFQTISKINGKKTLFHYCDEQWSFEHVDRFSNRIANYFIEQGFKKGDEVALFMDNRPEYVAIWLGLAKAGIITALVNNNLRSNSLIHSLMVVNCKALIFDSQLFEAVNEIQQQLLKSKKGQMKFYCFETKDNNNENFVYVNKFDYNALFTNLNAEMAKMSYQPPQSIIDSVSFTDCLLYIFTSGTEGLPKAAIIKNSRFIYMGAAVRYMININKNDILYTSLPLYHLAAGTLGVCQGVIFGNTVVLRNKFSASNFWKDCIRYNCTVAQYIGEICRYLLSQPQTQFDKTHSIRLMFGNGLRPNIWKSFVERFNIKQIGELYGSTEGNANIINVDNTEGSCGFISQIAPFLYPATLIKVDEQTGQPIRNKNGLCVKIKAGETGEFVGKITFGDPTRAFDGYANKEATKKKIIYNVFRKGDCAFASGDLLTMDKYGYLYFKDRSGDTFRWKGENVSTMELESIISNILQLTDCIIYGVEIPGCEGRAGMAAIRVKNITLNVNDLLEKMLTKLPLFMIPVFIRLVDQLEITSTHKMPKVTYRHQGFNPTIINDPMYYFDSKNLKYIPLNHCLYEELINGKLRI